MHDPVTTPLTSTKNPPSTNDLTNTTTTNDSQLENWPMHMNDWLADDIVKLNISDDANSPLHAQLTTTPPKAKMASAAVVQLSETSPLETSSIPSVGSSPHPSEHQISISHSRGSSTDTSISSSHESVLSGTSNTLLAPAHAPNKAGTIGGEVKERPHSFSGGLSSADLRRLQEADETPSSDDRHHWPSAGLQNNGGHQEQLSYPSLVNNSATLHRPQPSQPSFNYRANSSQETFMQSNRDDLEIDYSLQQRNFDPIPQSGVAAAGLASPFLAGRPTNMQNAPYRQLPRGFGQQGLLPAPSSMAYPTHTSHLSLGNTQQLYEMMQHPIGHDIPAVNRVQAQHSIYRGAHHHSASDPSAIREAATLALLNGNMQAFAPAMFQPAMAPPAAMPLYPTAGQYYGQDAYARPDLASQMAARLQGQYRTPYPIVPPQAVGMDGSLSSPTSTNGQTGPSANNRKLGLYKTELCRSWEEKGSCRYGNKCQFAHGEDELRNVARHPKYKTEICRTFWVSGSCPYGKRCCFIHTELPASGAANGAPPPAENTPQPSRPDTRARSLSTNSDPNDGSVSLLARITAKRNLESNANTPVDGNGSASNFQFSRPPTGSLRVDTALDGASLKQQNKSAYPTFASNGVLIPAAERIRAKSPAPVTAGPDLSRHNLNSRLEIVGGYNGHLRAKTGASSNSTARHSFNGDADGTFSPSPPITGQQYTMSSAVDGSSSAAPRANGHVRSGSAGNWGNMWTSDLAVGSSRLNEKAWA
ncbi:hypothetical protein HGRIS_007574 [Hohenbuehelia grisea]|uniref:C3H1-type domain-containing protein n=1 Tax=Hohenbuehelia grisea TaxID=104357 RepID=A0ABR3J585_9AGAR